MHNVLVIEDDAVVSEMLEIALLSIPECSVVCLRSAEDARKRFASGDSVDVLITDVHLPGEDGLSLVEALRNTPERRGLPVIVTTSSREPALRQRAESLGVLAFLEKPWSLAGLRNAVHSVLNGT
jgi:two-component system chemotaxis response regulator CheY